MQATRLGLAMSISFLLAGCVQSNAVQPARITGTHAIQNSRAGEARVGQTQGRVFISDEAVSRSKIKPVVSSTAAIGSASRPLTCGQQNMTDVACHTATQQFRPPTR